LARTTITVDGFLAAIARHGATVYLSLIGDAEPIARDAMAAVLDHAHLAGNHELASETVIDVRELDSISAECLDLMKTWIVAVRDMPRVLPYQITFLSDTASSWRRETLEQFQQLAPELIEIIL
jgi:hypothetical protein